MVRICIGQSITEILLYFAFDVKHFRNYTTAFHHVNLTKRSVVVAFYGMEIFQDEGQCVESEYSKYTASRYNSCFHAYAIGYPCVSLPNQIHHKLSPNICPPYFLIV